MSNSIVANSPAGGNCSGTINDSGGNLSYPDTTCPGINADPMLGPLQNNVGPTETMQLGPGSAAIDAGNDAICAAAPVNGLDQRGIAPSLGGALRHRRGRAAANQEAVASRCDIRGEQSLAQSRQTPRPLAGLASATDCTVAGTHHWPRTTGDREQETPGFAPGTSVLGQRLHLFGCGIQLYAGLESPRTGTRLRRTVPRGVSAPACSPRPWLRNST